MNALSQVLEVAYYYSQRQRGGKTGCRRSRPERTGVRPHLAVVLDVKLVDSFEPVIGSDDGSIQCPSDPRDHHVTGGRPRSLLGSVVTVEIGSVDGYKQNLFTSILCFFIIITVLTGIFFS